MLVDVLFGERGVSFDVSKWVGRPKLSDNVYQLKKSEEDWKYIYPKDALTVMQSEIMISVLDLDDEIFDELGKKEIGRVEDRAMLRYQFGRMDFWIFPIGDYYVLMSHGILWGLYIKYFYDLHKLLVRTARDRMTPNLELSVYDEWMSEGKMENIRLAEEWREVWGG